MQETLAGLGVTGIVLVGAATNWCIQSTVYGALERGYDLTLVGDAHTTESIELDSSGRIEAADIVRELNIVMTWVSYPDRTNSGGVLLLGRKIHQHWLSHNHVSTQTDH